MSPAPSGGLQVERYIGSCLISAPHYKRYPFRPEYGHYPPRQQGANWAGVPLISMNPGSPRRGKKNEIKTQEEQQRSPLSRLAVHTQGAPLIQSGRAPNNRGRGPHHKQQAPRNRPAEKAATVKEGSDSLSVASDESSANSENSLPRIIKPRKRRKKDRKPQQGAQAVQPAETPRPPAIVTLKPYTPLCKELGAEEEAPSSPGGEDYTEETVKCQCRYCDPVSVVWDVEARCYSPFLTPPAGGSPPPADPGWSSALEVSSEIVTSPNGHRDIEIKFFSTNAPLVPSPPPPRSPVCPPWEHRPKPEE